MIWFVLSLSAALFWAGGAILVKKGFENIPPLWNNIINNFLALFIFIPVVLFLSSFQLNIPTVQIYGVIVAACFLYQFFYYSISRGQISLTGTIVAGYPLVTIILSHIFLHERLFLSQYCGVVLILTGGIGIAIPDKKRPIQKSNLSWVLWGLVGAFTLGSGDFLTKLSINNIGAYSYIFFESLIINAFSCINYLVDKPHRTVPKIFSKKIKPTLLGIIMHLVGALFFLIAFDHGPASLISPVSSIYPAFVALLAIRFLKEVVTRRQGLSIGIIVIGLITVGLGSGL
jgi:uncharacterized membrane protein